jgi:hypothetical protein
MIWVLSDKDWPAGKRINSIYSLLFELKNLQFWTHLQFRVICIIFKNSKKNLYYYFYTKLLNISKSNLLKIPLH